MAITAAVADFGAAEINTGGPVGSPPAAAKQPDGPVPDDPLDQLALAASEGDDAAADDLLRRIQPAIVRYCRARIGRTGGTFASADDVAQDACLGIFLALRGYRPHGRSFLAFAYRVAANKVVDHYRKAGSNREACFAEPPESAVPGGGVASDPEQRCLERELSEQMRRLLGRVSERERDVLILRLVVGLSGAETARAVNMTPGAVRVAQHRAVAKLRTMLGH